MAAIQPVSIILLVHQEGDIIENVIRDFYTKIISKIPNSEFVVCEDGSTDKTKDVLKRIEKVYHLRLFLGDERKGYTKAMMDAFSYATKPIIFFSDSDGQHEPDDFWNMYALLPVYDMVIGWKQNRQDGFLRYVLTRVYNKIISVYFGVHFHDVDCGFRLMKKEVVDDLLKRNWHLNYCISSELTVRAFWGGFRIAEVPVLHRERKFGDSRGLPFKKLPGIIFHILGKFKAIKKDIKSFL